MVSCDVQIPTWLDVQSIKGPYFAATIGNQKGYLERFLEVTYLLHRECHNRRSSASAADQGGLPCWMCGGPWVSDTRNAVNNGDREGKGAEVVARRP